MTPSLLRGLGRCVLASWLIAIASSARASAQLRATLAGRVLDEAGQAVRGARIMSTVDSVLGVSDEHGRFTLRGLTPGFTRFDIRRIGYAPGEFSVALVAAETLLVDLKVDQAPTSLPGMETRAESHAREMLGAFNRHRAAPGNGHFLTRAEIARQNPRVLSDVVRKVPGVLMIPGQFGESVRMARAMGATDCPVQYFVDGVRAPTLALDDLPPGDIEGLEIYDGPASLPPEFNDRRGQPTCGTIAIWTRVPGA